MHYMTAVVQLPLIREPTKERIRSPDEVARICSDMRDLAQETFHVLMLNTRNTLVNRHMVTVGLIDASLVHPREVFRQAVMENASAIVLVHTRIEEVMKRGGTLSVDTATQSADCAT